MIILVFSVIQWNLCCSIIKTFIIVILYFLFFSLHRYNQILMTFCHLCQEVSSFVHCNTFRVGPFFLHDRSTIGLFLWAINPKMYRNPLYVYVWGIPFRLRSHMLCCGLSFCNSSIPQTASQYPRLTLSPSSSEMEFLCFMLYSLILCFRLKSISVDS